MPFPAANMCLLNQIISARPPRLFGACVLMQLCSSRTRRSCYDQAPIAGVCLDAPGRSLRMKTSSAGSGNAIGRKFAKQAILLRNKRLKSALSTTSKTIILPTAGTERSVIDRLLILGSSAAIALPYSDCNS